jgi:hypothetical protein
MGHSLPDLERADLNGHDLDPLVEGTTP